MTRMIRTGKLRVMFWGGVLLFFLFLQIWGLDIAIHKPLAGAPEHGVHPDSWPVFIVNVIILCSIIQTYYSYKDYQSERESGQDIGEPLPFTVPNLILTLGLIVLYWFLVTPLGIATASFMFFVGLSIKGGEKNIPLLLVSGAALCYGLYFFFLEIARIPLPPGPFGGVI